MCSEITDPGCVEEREHKNTQFEEKEGIFNMQQVL